MAGSSFRVHCRVEGPSPMAHCPRLRAPIVLSCADRGDIGETPLRARVPTNACCWRKGVKRADWPREFSPLAQRHQVSVNKGLNVKLAEREGFEPSVEFPLHTLSKRAPSATRTSLRAKGCEAFDSSMGLGGPARVPARTRDQRVVTGSPIFTIFRAGFLSPALRQSRPPSIATPSVVMVSDSVRASAISLRSEGSKIWR